MMSLRYLSAERQLVADIFDVVVKQENKTLIECVVLTLHIRVPKTATYPEDMSHYR